MAFCKLLLDLSSCGVRLLHPWVIDNVSQRKSLMWRELEHSRDEILEVFREETGLFVLAVHVPE